MQSAVHTVLVVVALFVQAFTLSGCELPIYHGKSSHKLPTTTTASTTTSSSAPTTTSTGSAMCADDTAFKDGYRPDAPFKEQEGIDTYGACCEACQAKKRCWVWSFQVLDNKCYFTDKSSPFGSGDYNASTGTGEIGLIKVQEFIMGIKRSGTCDGCWDHPEWGGGCGRREEDHSAMKDCAKCDDPNNWAEYPCFLASGCVCGGDQQFPPPGPSDGPGGDDGDWDGGDDDWDGGGDDPWDGGGDDAWDGGGDDAWDGGGDDVWDGGGDDAWDGGADGLVASLSDAPLTV